MDLLFGSAQGSESFVPRAASEKKTAVVLRYRGPVFHSHTPQEPRLSQGIDYPIVGPQRSVMGPV